MAAFDAIPLELRQRRQWVVWRYEERDGKRTKPPRRVDGSGYASADDPATWSGFEEARAAVEAGRAVGVGYVFSADDPFVGLDFDDCLEGSALHPDVAALVLHLDSYTEVSPSGQGVKSIVRADLNGFPRHRTKKTSWGSEFEVYADRRFFALTGEQLRGYPVTIEPRQDELGVVLERVFGKSKQQATPPASTGAGLDESDEELLRRAFDARNGVDVERLYGGDASAYGSRSEADLALCGSLAFWAGPDPARIDALFRSSGLMREKWDTRRGESSYGAQTVAKALEGRTEFYSASAAAPTPEPTAPRETRPVAGPRSLRLTALNTIEMRSIEWKERPLWQDSAFQLLAGTKGAGKGTYLAGFAARRIRGGESVIFISTEDSASIDLKPRLVAAGVDPDAEGCYLIEEHVVLPDDIPRLHELGSSVPNLGLLVIDPVANHIGARDSNAESEVRDAIAPLNSLADALSCLIVGVRHPGKDRSRGAVASILGSTAWTAVPRAVVVIAKDDADPQLRHIQVVAGNRSLNGSAQAFRIEAVEVAGLKEPVTRAIELGDSGRDVEDLLESGSGSNNTKSDTARELILDILDAEGEQESDALDARVAREAGLAARTVQNIRGELRTAGLIRSVAETVEGQGGQRKCWKVQRTLAPRAADGEPS